LWDYYDLSVICVSSIINFEFGPPYFPDQRSLLKKYCDYTFTHTVHYGHDSNQCVRVLPSSVTSLVYYMYLRTERSFHETNIDGAEYRSGTSHVVSIMNHFIDIALEAGKHRLVKMCLQYVVYVLNV
jgi:hypothetical protein